jgi:hypothetical protein
VARYQYAGPGPVPDPESGEVIRPGDVREFPEEPAYGPWELLDGPDTPAPVPDLTPEEMGELKKEADAGLAAPPAPFLSAVTPKGM